jgi:hypothetical protein
MRSTIIAVAAFLIFAAFAYGGVLQDRARRKAYGPGTSIFSMSAMFRSLGRKKCFTLSYSLWRRLPLQER